MAQLGSGYGPSLILLSVLPLLYQKRPKYFKLAAHREDFEQLSVGNWLATFSVHD